MKKIRKCATCNGTGKREETDYGFLRLTIVKRDCTSCTGTGLYEIDEYICKHCNYIHIKFDHDIFTGQCESCYADAETGEYIDNFFYVIQETLPEISQKVNILLKEGYIPMGRPLQLNEYCIAQAVIKKELMV